MFEKPMVLIVARMEVQRVYVGCLEALRVMYAADKEETIRAYCGNVQVGALS